MSFPEQLGPEVNDKYVSNIEKERRKQEEMRTRLDDNKEDLKMSLTVVKGLQSEIFVPITPPAVWTPVTKELKDMSIALATAAGVHKKVPGKIQSCW